MIERILEIIKQKNLTPSQFAEEIGIQRSSISHLVSGRNKPSLEFVQKILSTYTDINPEWLLNGTGHIFRTDGNAVTENIDQLAAKVSSKTFEEPDLFESESLQEPNRAEIRQMKKKKSITTDEKQVEKIVYFYKDQSFREYYPDNN